MIKANFPIPLPHLRPAQTATMKAIPIPIPNPNSIPTLPPLSENPPTATLHTAATAPQLTRRQPRDRGAETATSRYPAVGLLRRRTGSGNVRGWLEEGRIRLRLLIRREEAVERRICGVAGGKLYLGDVDPRPSHIRHSIPGKRHQDDVEYWTHLGSVWQSRPRISQSRSI